MDISRTGMRLARTAVFTALCVALSSASHVLLSGAPLPAPTVAAVSALIFAVAYPLTGREARYRHIAGLLIPLEIAADTIFTTGQAACYGAGDAGLTAAAAPLRIAGVSLLCAGGDFGTPLARLAMGAGAAADPAGPWLLLGLHVVVGLLAAAWLRGGEAALARVLRATADAALRPLLAAASATGAPQVPPAPPVTAHRPRSARSALLAHSVQRRGPPGAAPALAA